MSISGIVQIILLPASLLSTVQTLNRLHEVHLFPCRSPGRLLALLATSASGILPSIPAQRVNATQRFQPFDYLLLSQKEPCM